MRFASCHHSLCWLVSRGGAGNKCAPIEIRCFLLCPIVWDCRIVVCKGGGQAPYSLVVTGAPDGCAVCVPDVPVAESGY